MSKENNTITINGEELTIKPGLKAMMIFEKECKKAFELKTTTDIMHYLHASLLAGSKGAQLSFDDMIDAFEENPELIQQCTDMILRKNAIEEVVRLSNQPENEGGNEPKKE